MDSYKIRENLWCTLITSLICIIETEAMSKETALFSLQRSKGVYWQFLLDFQNCAGRQCNLQCRFCHRLGHLTHCETRSPEITLFTLGSLPSGERVSVYIKSMHLWTCAKKRSQSQFDSSIPLAVRHSMFVFSLDNFPPRVRGYPSYIKSSVFGPRGRR